MSLVSIPFETVGIHIVGPLVQSTSRRNFLLNLVDYATHYSKTVPLCNMRVDMIAREQAQVFTHMGIPKQLVTNQRTSFMKEVLQAVWWLLGVQSLHTSLYYPQTNGHL